LTPSLARSELVFNGCNTSKMSLTMIDGSQRGRN
jgi:hypothetical protein